MVYFPPLDPFFLVNMYSMNSSMRSFLSVPHAAAKVMELPLSQVSIRVFMEIDQCLHQTDVIVIKEDLHLLLNFLDPSHGMKLVQLHLSLLLKRFVLQMDAIILIRSLRAPMRLILSTEVLVARVVTNKILVCITKLDKQ
jgi:hypothetical protein